MARAGSYTRARLLEHQIEAAADLMNRVFLFQLRSVSVEPTADEQRAYLEGYLRVVRYCFAHGEPYAASIGDKVVGLAPWMAPHTLDVVEEEQVEYGMHELGGIFRPSIGHLYALERAMIKFEQESLKQPYWFMPSRLDIDPAYMRRGIASALLRPVLLRADEGKLPCYVETILPLMVPFFQKHGFEVLKEGNEPSSGARFWILRRLPERN